MKTKIINGLIVDGTNAKPYEGQIVINGSRIEKIILGEDREKTIKESNLKIIDARGSIVAPGFIDIHSHSDVSNFAFEKSDSKIRQGITTEIAGNCGISTFPTRDENVQSYTGQYKKMGEVKYKGDSFPWRDLDTYVEYASRDGSYTNLAMLVGHGTLRANTVGFSDKELDKEELEDMKEVLDKLLVQGAFGMSLGLIYPPGIFSNKYELVELSKVLAKRNKILSVHLRNESDGVFEAVEEMLDVARKSRVRLQISHLKLVGKNQWGKGDKLLKLINDARKEGVDVSCDQYPYEATATSLAAIAPKWAKAGGNDELVLRLENPSEKLEEDILEEIEKRGGVNAVLIANTHGEFPHYEGKRLLEISKEESLSPFEIVRQILIKTRASARAIYFSMHEDDIINIMKSEFVSIGSDGYSMSTNYEELGYNPHPRNFGTFPKFLEIVREKNLMPIEKAVYKMTGLNANILGLKDRGFLKEGYIADITIFDKDLIKDNSTYISSVEKPSGVEYVLVNGELTIDNGDLQVSKSGDFLTS